MVFPIGRIAYDYPLYCFTNPVRLRELGSGSESSSRSASNGSTSSADGCTGGRCTGSSAATRGRYFGTPTDNHRAPNTNHDQGSGAWRIDHAASASARNKSTNDADDGESRAADCAGSR